MEYATGDQNASYTTELHNVQETATSGDIISKTLSLSIICKSTSDLERLMLHLGQHEVLHGGLPIRGLA
jgi:hypothetical protein